MGQVVHQGSRYQRVQGVMFALRVHAFADLEADSAAQQTRQRPLKYATPHPLLSVTAASGYYTVINHSNQTRHGVPGAPPKGRGAQAAYRG